MSSVVEPRTSLDLEPPLLLPHALGSYELLECTARGAACEVYRARSLGVAGFSRFVSVQRLRSTALDRPQLITLFTERAKLAARVHHQSIAQLFALDRLPQGEWLAGLELCPGSELPALVSAARDRGEELPLWIALHFATGIFGALAHAHELTDDSGAPAPAIHGCFSPKLVRVGASGEIKLSEFGVGSAVDLTAQILDGDPRAGVGYLAPEILLGKKPVTASDVFAASAVLWELLAQRRLFDAPSAAASAKLITSGVRVRASIFQQELPRDLDDLLLAALDPSPDQRPPARELLELCADLLGELRPRGSSEELCRIASSVPSRAPSRRPISYSGPSMPAVRGTPQPLIAFGASVWGELASGRDAIELISHSGARRVWLDGELEAAWAEVRPSAVRAQGATPIPSHRFVRLAGLEHLIEGPTIRRLGGVGELARTPVSTLLADLASKRLTGRLVLMDAASGSRRDLELIDGAPVYVAAYAPELSLPALIDRRGEPGLRGADFVADVLARGLSLRELLAAVRRPDRGALWLELMRDRLAGVFQWSRGRWAFDLDAAFWPDAPFADSAAALIPRGPQASGIRSAQLEPVPRRCTSTPRRSLDS